MPSLTPSRRRLLLLIVLSTSVAVPAVASATEGASHVRASAATVKYCRNLSEGGPAVTLSTRRLRAGRGVSCSGARRLVRRYFRNSLNYGSCYPTPGRCRVRGWTFVTRFNSDYRVLVRAKRHGRQIAFRRIDRPHDI
jgi:hypothetical protein